MTTSQVLDELLAERNFLLARCSDAGSFYFNNPKRWTGTSSNALVAHVFGASEPTTAQYPRDPSDLMACYRTIHRLPDHLKPKARSILERYRVAVASRYPLNELDSKLAEEGIDE